MLLIRRNVARTNFLITFAAPVYKKFADPYCMTLIQYLRLNLRITLFYRLNHTSLFDKKHSSVLTKVLVLIRPTLTASFE